MGLNSVRNTEVYLVSFGVCPAMQEFTRNSPQWNDLTVCIVTDLLKALLGNGSVNTFQQATMGDVFSVDECYSSLLRSTTILVTALQVGGVSNLRQ
jgi:hypothetical protein